MVEREVADGLDPVDLDEAALADDRDPVAGPVDLVDDVRGQEDRSGRRPRASRTSSKNVCWTSGSRPDVGSSRMSRSGRCWSATISPTFCLLPLRVLLEAPARVEVEALDELGDVRPVDAAAQVGEVGDRVGAGQPVVQVELARQVADPPVDRDRIGGRLDAEDLGAAATSAG